MPRRPPTALACATALLLTTAAVAASTPDAAPAAVAFRGAALVAIHDGDMLASAYVDGQLGPPQGRDALTVTTFSPDLGRMDVAAVEVSNSVAGTPTAVAVTRDGRFAVVSESFGPRGVAARRFAELPPGARLTLVDIADLRAPRVVQTLEVGRRPEGLSISPAGDLVALALHPQDGRMLAFVPFAEGRLGQPSHLAVPGLRREQRITHVEWHPSGRFVAVVLSDDAEVRFLRVERPANGVAVSAWGNPVRTSKYPFMGRFTPDGRHFLTGNLYWGPDVGGFWTEAPRGDATAIRFASKPEAASGGGEAVRHRLVGRAETGISPEGLAISPDGRWVVSVNLERSFAPAEDARLTPFASLTLMRLSPGTGRLEAIGTYAYDGVLPEAIAFDASGRFLAVTTFERFDRRRPGGVIDFWRLVDGDEPRLVQLRRSVDVPHGPHSMVLVP